MADNKRYYWLKLPKDFFERKEVKLLRKLENGALYVLIYQKIPYYTFQFILFFINDA